MTYFYAESRRILLAGDVTSDSDRSYGNGIAKQY